jgi:glycosyltransferase involved in cell wall biosynthesis
MGGALRHLTNFLPELSLQDSSREYVVLLRDSLPALELKKNIRFELVSDGQISGWLSRIHGDVIELPKKLEREKFSAIVSLTNFGPIWTSVPHIFFQRNSLYYCSYYLAKITGRLKLETLLRRRLAIESMKRADLIVTPSNAMAEMIRETCPAVRNRFFSTLYHGFTTDSMQEPLAEKFRSMLSVDSYKLLYPTHPAPHKGFDILFNLLALLKKEGLQCTLFTTIEKKDWPSEVEKYEKQIQKLSLNDSIVFMGRIPQGQMGELYQACDLMIYPSLCESFGFSMIEAMGYNLPVIAADTPINKEICGEAVLYYPSLDSAAGAKAVKMALNDEVLNNLKKYGKEKTRSFDWSWKRYTKNFLNIMENVSL